MTPPVAKIQVLYFLYYDDSSAFQVIIDYKGQDFTGIKNGEKLTRLIIEMNFEKVGGTWRLTDLELKDIQYNVSLNLIPDHILPLCYSRICCTMWRCLPLQMKGTGCLLLLVWLSHVIPQVWK